MGDKFVSESHRHFWTKDTVRTQGCSTWPTNQAVAKLGTVAGA